MSVAPLTRPGPQPASAHPDPHPGLNPTQQQTLTEVLDLRGPRPVARPGLVEDLRAHLDAGTRSALATWPERSLFVSKAQLANVARCEGLYRHTKNVPRTPGLIPAVARGTVIHRALQHCHTHPHAPVGHNVRTALEACVATDDTFATFWSELGTAEQSDLIVAATGTAMTFLDSWPPLHETWSPRFEHGMQARVGALTLAGRVDLLLGRPRPDATQSMVVVDWKSGTLYPEHEGEADFYALLATLRFGIPPFRSFLYSLASAQTTEMDVTEERLFRAADALVAAVNSIVEVMGETRPPQLTPTAACSWCPGRETCPALAALTPLT